MTEPSIDAAADQARVTTPPTFIDAIIQIATHPELGLTICEDIEERRGGYPSLCVFHRGVFLGKLRWPKGDQPATVDQRLVEHLR